MRSVFILALMLGSAAAHFHLDVHLQQSGLESFEKTFWDISTPGSDSYLKFLSREQVASMIGASDVDLALVHEWLISNGGSDVKTSALHDTVTATFVDTPSALKMGRNGVPHKETHPACVEFVVRRDPMESTSNKQTESLRVPRLVKGTSADSMDYTVSNIKDSYGIPTDLQASNANTQQMVWGPGTFGYSVPTLKAFSVEQAPLINTDKIYFTTENHGERGGDNFMEGQLDVDMISAFGLNVTTLVSNTNTSASTEETTGFGAALLDFITQLAASEYVPNVLSMSLGSLSAASCDYLCTEAVSAYGHTLEECQDYMETQRQVCMYLSQDQTTAISTAFQVLGTRGVTILGSSGDGGSHFSFMPFTPSPDDNGMADDLNSISCAHQIPVFPTASPYIVSVGGEMWDGDSSHPITWSSYPYGSGGGVSIQFDMPEHQKKTVAAYYASNTSTTTMPPTTSYDATKRAYPDVSALGVSGTSQSCPILAGIFAMLIDMRLNQGLPSLGFVAPLIYQIAENFPGEAFEDIIGGNSGLACGDEGGFPASEGWDANTGFGRPVWEGMVKHFVV